MSIKGRMDDNVVHIYSGLPLSHEKEWNNASWSNTDGPMKVKESVSHSVVSNFLWPQGLYPTRLLCPWDSPGKNAGVGCHFLPQGIFLTQGLNLDLLQCRQILYHLSLWESPSLWESSSHTVLQMAWTMGRHSDGHWQMDHDFRGGGIWKAIFFEEEEIQRC